MGEEGPPALKPARLLTAGAGLLLLAVPFLPLSRIVGGIRADSAWVAPGDWLLGLAIFAAAAWLLAAMLPARASRRFEGRVASLADTRSDWPALAFLAVLAAILLTVSALVFEHRPLHVDGVAQLFQAKIFATGRASAPAPPAPEFFLTPQMIIEDGKWYSQYPPGHAGLLALGVLVGAPWIVPIALSLAAAAFLWGFARRAYDRPTAWVTLLLLVLAPFFWFLGASFMSHVSSLAGVCASLYCLARWEADRRAAFLGAAGAALGAAFLSRPLEALAIAIVLGSAASAHGARARRWTAPVWFGAGFLTVAFLYLAFNAATTGDPFRPGYIELWGSAHGLGFHDSPWGVPHTPGAGLRNGLLDLALLEVYLFEWPIPSLLPLAVALGAGWLTRRWDVLLVAAFLAVPSANFFYWHRDTFLGPRFVHVMVAFAVPLTARALVEGARRLKDRTWKPGGFPRIEWRAWAFLTLLLSALYAVAYAIPARFLIHKSSMGSMRLDLVQAARAQGIDRGIVFVAESWGSRVIASLRGLGASAALVERAYRQADLCELDAIVRRARAEAWSAEEVEAALAKALVGEGSLVVVEAPGGATARFRPGSRLTAECMDEIRYDEGGYTLFTPHLIADDPALSGDLVIARDLRAWNGVLVDRMPGRAPWIYRGGEFFPWNAGP